MRTTVLFCLICLAYSHLRAQQPATIREYEKTYKTYPFSEPDPVANDKGIYPYFRFDGFTAKAEEKKWKVVELENDFIRVDILPQVGGKIWTAIDKKNGKPFIYDNDVIKFRDIAMRGPWTSGGLEANYGVIGHTPGVATPVNYLTRKNDDGSVSCIISLIDLLTETKWSMEIRLPQDKAYFITRSVWHNGTGLNQPYYSWMNLGEKVSDSLEYIFPGNHYLFHDGKLYDWPYNKENGKHISIYDQNDFGSYKSYHVTGVYADYYGAFWRKENFGMIHYSPRQDKIGKKIWIWGLSRQGMIWEKMLTDHSGQYTEIQSGRLFNQNAPESVLTPFKQFYFMPFNTDTWTEYWYPFQNTGGVTTADLNAVYHLKDDHDTLALFISPVSQIEDTLKVLDKAGSIIYRKWIKLQPLRSVALNLPPAIQNSMDRITLSGSVIALHDSAAKTLDRPLKSFDDFDWSSAYGLYQRGKYAAGTRHYEEAETFIHEALKKAPLFMPALTEMAVLQLRKMNDDSAFYYARKALSVDTYDPAANYYYGLAAWKLGKWYDALDGFQVATLTPVFRSAAYTQICKMHLQKKQYDDVFHYASEALVNNTKNISALQLQALAARLLNRTQTADSIREVIRMLDPLNDFIRFESYRQNKNEKTRNAFTGLIRDELPRQSYLRLADFYLSLHLSDDGEAVLEACPDRDDEIKYWLAYLHRNDRDWKKWLDTADAGNPLFVFPFRAQSAQVMNWATGHSGSWKPKYYLALITASHGNRQKAGEMLNAISETVPFAPFYVSRARMRDSSDIRNIEDDYRAAITLDQTDWRYGKYLAAFLLDQDRGAEALKAIASYYKKDPANYVVGLLYIRCLIANDKYQEAEKALSTIEVLPFEGSTVGHKLYEQVKLMGALRLLRNKKYEAALTKVSEARLWPENLGEGKPYPDMINEKLEDEIENLIRETEKTKRPAAAEIGQLTEKVRSLK